MMKRMWPLMGCLVGAATLCASAFGAGEPKADPRVAQAMAVDAQTIFLLHVDPAKNALVDKTGAFTPAVEGGTVADDATWGKCLRFGEGERNSISVPDDGKMGLKGGFTFEAWVRLDTPTAGRGGVVATKRGSFTCSLSREGKFNITAMTYPGEEISAYANANGFMTVPVNKWVHLAIAYDEDRSLALTWIDGMPDRYRYRVQAGQPLGNSPGNPLQILPGVKNCSVAVARLSRGMRRVGPVPALEVYISQLPYQGKIMLTFDHIDKSLTLPLDVTAVWEKPTGDSATLQTLTLDSHEKKDVLLDPPTWTTWHNVLHTVRVNVCSAGEIVFSRQVRVAYAAPSGTVNVDPDRSLSVHGKKVFPLLVYHAEFEDFPLLAELGFNMIVNEFKLSIMRTRTKDPAPDLILTLRKANLKAAQANNLLVLSGGNKIGHNDVNNAPVLKNEPALAGWYTFDEPWSDITKVLEGYNVAKLMDPDKPIVVTQNNLSRLQETAEGADIISVDPYVGRGGRFRYVASATKAGVLSVSGRKPVWTILGQYGRVLPSRGELRCEVYLAIISGANGLGVYAWDDRGATGGGWYTKDHAEQVENLRAVLGELKKIEHILVIPNSDRTTAFEPADRALHAAIKEADGKQYLLLASDAREAMESVLAIDGIADAEGRCLHDGGKNENIRIAGGQASVKLPALGAAVYEIILK